VRKKRLGRKPSDFQLLKLGFIKECDDDYPSPPHPVLKSDNDNGIRFTIDYRAKNVGIVAEPCPMLNIFDILHACAGKTRYARLDLVSSYWQFPVRVTFYSIFITSQQRAA
jgi:hypothetical protein